MAVPRAPRRLAFCPACGADHGLFVRRPHRVCADVLCPRYNFPVTLERKGVPEAGRLREEWAIRRTVLEAALERKYGK